MDFFKYFVFWLTDLREAKVDCVTLGQYMQPTKLHLKVTKFITFAVDHPLLATTIFGWHCHNKWLERVSLRVGMVG